MLLPDQMVYLQWENIYLIYVWMFYVSMCLCIVYMILYSAKDYSWYLISWQLFAQSLLCVDKYLKMFGILFEEEPVSVVRTPILVYTFCIVSSLIIYYYESIVTALKRSTVRVLLM